MHAPATAPATAWWCDTSALLFYMALGTLLHMHACTYIVNSAQNFQHFPNAQVHIPWAVLCSSDNRIHRWNARAQVHLGPVHFFFFFAPSNFILEEHFLILRFRLGGPFSRKQFWPRIWRAPGVPRREIYLFVFLSKMDRTGGEKQNVEGRFVCFR